MLQYQVTKIFIAKIITYDDINYIGNIENRIDLKFSLLLGMLEYPHGQLILAGDPKQLGPVLRSPIALKCGLQISLLERLMLSPDNANESRSLIYQRSKLILRSKCV